MALQGTLETFSVPEVLRLLAGTQKTGLLALDGDRGAGKVWFSDGRIVSVHSDHEQGDRVDAVLFDLLRFTTGSFVFDSSSRPADTLDAEVDVEEVLSAAESMLEEWRDIEAVVPSLDVRVHMVDEIAGESVTITAEQWRCLALVGSGISARRLGAHLDLGEFDACSLVRDLVRAELVEVTEDVFLVPDTGLDTGTGIDHGTEDGSRAEAADAFVDHDLSHDEVTTLGENLAGFVAQPAADLDPELDTADDAVDDHGVDADAEPDPVVTAETAPEPEPEPEAEADDEIESEPESEEFLSQLANFSPKAAAALEATAGDETASDDEVGHETDDAEAVVAGAQVPAAEGDEEINRNLLLKFLSSAKN